MKNPVITNSIIHVLLSFPGISLNDSHECQRKGTGNTSHISRELQIDIKEKKKKKKNPVHFATRNKRTGIREYLKLKKLIAQGRGANSH